ncbi:MAG: CinA family protein, partial [Thermoflexales bacterium]
TALAEAERAADDLRARWRAHANDRIAAALDSRGWTIGTAESCTGGQIADTLTDRAGSSGYFLGGIISYDNRVKRERLGVMAETLETAGAVSPETALEMARGARRALGVDVAVSATGIAGPGGGSADKPVGLVWLAISAPAIERAERHVWPFDRAGNKRASADAALRLLLQALEPDPAE